jgi:tetratricopeptide (TPR) repeat protein
MKTVSVVEAGEADIIEHMATSRLAYRQYNYIIEASLAGPNLKAKDSDNKANYLYDEAYRLEKAAKRLFVKPFIDENLLRVTLDKYNQVIKQYPTSDKIDDAAYRAGGIYEYFKDYTIALLYYQRAYQWDSATANPARFKAAYILDQYLHRRAEALPLYQYALGNEKLSKDEQEFVQKRIEELTKGGESLEENK